MKHLRKDSTKHSTSDDLSFEACCDFLQQALIKIYEQYVYSLVFVKQNKKEFSTLYKKWQEYDEWCLKKYEVEPLMNKKYKTEEEEDAVYNFIKSKEPPQPTNGEKKFVRKYIREKNNIEETEWFYHSDRFQNVTLGQEDGDAIIEKAKRKANNGGNNISKSKAKTKTSK